MFHGEWKSKSIEFPPPRGKKNVSLRPRNNCTTTTTSWLQWLKNALTRKAHGNRLRRDAGKLKVNTQSSVWACVFVKVVFHRKLALAGPAWMIRNPEWFSGGGKVIASEVWSGENMKNWWMRGKNSACDCRWIIQLDAESEVSSCRRFEWSNWNWWI